MVWMMNGIESMKNLVNCQNKYLELSYHQLLSQCEVVLNNYSVTADMARNVEKHTRGQALSKIWFQQRAGRVTASKLKAAVSTNMAQPSISLIKALCYPESNCFKSEATSWDAIMKSQPLQHILPRKEKKKH